MSERTPKHARRGQRGTALVLSLILVFVCAGLGAAFIQVASSSASRQSHEIRQLQAFYLAEAGLAEGFMAVRMGRTGSVASEATPATYGDGEIFVESVHTSDGRVFLRSSAERERSSAVLGLIVKPSSLRDRVVPRAPLASQPSDSCDAAARRRSWAELLQRVFAEDVLRCPRCGGRRHRVSTITDPFVVRRILRHIGARHEPRPLAPARPPPQGVLDFA